MLENHESFRGESNIRCAQYRFGLDLVEIPLQLTVAVRVWRLKVIPLDQRQMSIIGYAARRLRLKVDEVIRCS